MTATFISGNIFADKCYMQLRSFHVREWSIETLSTTRKAIFGTVLGRDINTFGSVHVS
jgi:hypothetical protein